MEAFYLIIMYQYIARIKCYIASYKVNFLVLGMYIHEVAGSLLWNQHILYHKLLDYIKSNWN